MSKHPGNPYWHQERDVPIMIMSRREWDAAAEAGHLTPEHVFTRLHNIAVYAFGEDMESPIAFDEHGFVLSLTAAGISLEGGITLRVYPNDHPPPHVHIELRSHPGAKLRLRLDNGEYLDEPPKGLSTKKLNGFKAAITESHEVLTGWWEEYHGDPVTVG
ncbi:DUF4160 domain-containing protein [Nocardioides sediminis]|uniref:DUF4160 domain-containing protein n=1 Tax=Nocardioides sediminis TaxID=433648 RepID=UPI00131EEE0D|nr:DUF4160 domain-containing protein [Nocardioides sediminis]